MLKSFVERLLGMSVLLDAEGDAGGGGGTPDGGTPVADNNGKPQAGDGSGKPANDGQPGSGGKKEPVEDPRIKGMLADLKKEREARQKYERELAADRAELERERKRVRALSGLDNPSKEEQDDAAIRARMETLYPWMKGLTQEDIDAIRESRGQAEEFRNATTHQWKAHGTKMLGAVSASLQKALGGKLSDRQTARIHQAYVEEARSNPDFLARHESGDMDLVDEFVKEWLDDFVEPGRRSALQQETQQRRPRVPSGKDRSIVGQDNKPIDVKDDKQVGDVLVAGFKARGGQFGRR